MPVTQIDIQSSFMPTYAADPPIPTRLSLHDDSKAMFKAAGDNVSFTGCCHLPTAVIYLHPLVAVAERGNQEIGMLPVGASHPAAGAIDGVRDPNPILHPNMSPALRAQAGLTSGHHQICSKHGLKLEECVGFAVTKRAGQSLMTTSSQTLNSDKFKGQLPMMWRDAKPAHRLKLDANRLGTGVMTKEWAHAIANAIELSFSVTATGGGNFEAPF